MKTRGQQDLGQLLDQKLGPINDSIAKLSDKFDGLVSKEEVKPIVQALINKK